jgi:hypothetical protein
MDDKFDKFIRDNREKFDVRDPDPGIWSRIEDNIRTKKRWGWQQILQRVAIVTAIFTASYVVNEFIHRYRNGDLRARHSPLAGKDSALPGLRETEAYYASLVNQKLDELKPIIANCPSLREELNFDMSELDSVYTDLKNDLKDNMANQEVIEAIIENYRLKIKILESLLTEIKPREDECLSKKDSYAL